MATVVDQFIVKYTLDTKDLDKGIRNTGQKLEKFKRETVEAGNTLGTGIEAGAKRATGALGVLGAMLGKGGLAGVAIGSLIYVASIANKKLFTTAESLRQIGISSKNLGMAASSMRNLQYASELAGGSMQDATQDIASLSKSLFDLKFNGQVSDSLVMLSRLGVQFTDSYGRARDFNDVMLDTASAIERAKNAGRMTDAEGYQFALQAGFSGGDANLVNGGVANFNAAMATQKGRRQIQDKDIAGGTKAVNTVIGAGQAANAELLNASMATYGESVDFVVGGLEDFGTAVVKAAKVLMDSFVNPSSYAVAPATMGNRGAAPYSSAISAASKKHGIPEEVLIGMMRTESGFNPNVVSPKGARGLMQIMPDTGKDLGIVPGQDPAADINAAARYLAQLRASGAKTLGLNPMASMAYAVDAYHTGEGNIRNHTNIGPESMAYSSKVLSGTAFQAQSRPWMGGGSSSNVNIEHITVNTQATNGEGIAASIGSETAKRKLLTAHAENGPQ